MEIGFLVLGGEASRGGVECRRTPVGGQLSGLVKNRPYVLTMLGLFIMAQSFLWEYVRMRPTYRFVVEPWSTRGYETTQGWIILTAAVWLMVVATMMVLGKIKETPLHSFIVVGLTSLFPVVAAILTDAKNIVPGGMGVVLLSILGSVVIGGIVSRFALRESLEGAARVLTRVGVWIVSLLVLILVVFGPLFGSRSTPAWIIVAVAFGMLGSLALTRPPERLAVWRVLINSVLALWLLTVTMGASLRWDQLNAQLANLGVSAEIGDIGITSGIMLCWLGGLLAFAGTVSMWAKRRDLIAARDRARHQQEAARESQAQLAEAPV